MNQARSLRLPFAVAMLVTGTFACSANDDVEATDSSSSAVTVVPSPVGPVVAIIRSYNPAINDHLLGTEGGEGAPYWYPEGVAFKLIPNPAPGLAPLLRCNYGGRHFLSNDPGCEGWTPEGLLGFVSSVPQPGLAPIVRCYHPPTGDHLTTLDGGECIRAGYVIEGGQGFASP